MLCAVQQKNCPKNFCLQEQVLFCEANSSSYILFHRTKFAITYTNQGEEGSAKKGGNTATSREAVQSEGVQHLC